MRRPRSAGRPRRALPDPVNTLTGRVRRLIDIAHDGKVRNASQLTGIPYPTLNDLYIGRTVNPNLATLDRLRAPYGIDLTWLLSEDEPTEAPLTGIVAFLPPDPRAEVKRRSLREVQIPYSAWSMYEVLSSLEARLRTETADANRPIVGEATGDALLFRLSTFLFQPLLAAEKSGEQGVFVGSGEQSETVEHERRRWITKLVALGDMWRATLPMLLQRGSDTDA